MRRKWREAPPFPSHRLLVRVELPNCYTDAPFNQPVRFDSLSAPSLTFAYRQASPLHRLCDSLVAAALLLLRRLPVPCRRRHPTATPASSLSLRTFSFRFSAYRWPARRFGGIWSDDTPSVLFSAPFTVKRLNAETTQRNG